MNRTPASNPSWIDRLEDHGKQVTKERRKQKAIQKPLPPVQETFITIRGASENDPGQIDVGYFIVEDGMVTLTDPDGVPIKDMKPEKLGNADPKYIAGLLTRKRREEGGGDFTRRLDYGPSGWR